MFDVDFDSNVSEIVDRLHRYVQNKIIVNKLELETENRIFYIYELSMNNFI